MSGEYFALSLLALLAIASLVLGWFALGLWRKVWQQRKQQEQQQLELAQTRANNEQKRLSHIHESINVIASAVLDDQCPLTEGCIRLAVLLDNLPLNCSNKHEYSVLFEVYQATRHIPTHDQWKALTRKQRKQYEREMTELETQHEQRIKTVMAAIKAEPFPRAQSH